MSASTASLTMTVQEWKPCNIASSEAHNRRAAEYMRHIGESRIYVVPELSTDNEQWINPDFGSPDLRMHYDNAPPYVKECCLSGRTPHWLMYANSVKSVKDAGASLHYKFSCTKTKGIG